jgi:hypothetical protein
MSEIKIETASAGGGGGGGSGTVTSVAVNTGTAGTDVNRTGSPITTSGTIVINIPVASAANTGKLSNTDWSTFNGKQAALVSGTNIKTVNSTTLLGSGDLAVQAVLVSGTNIKTLNSNSLLGAGNIDVQPTLVSGTNIKTLNSNSLLGAGNLAVQDPLVSGGNINTINSASILGPGNTQLQVPLVSAVNIKTVNGNSLLGSGDLVISGGGGSPAGSTGQVQFNNAGAFGADATLFWDNTNKRAGFGISASLLSRVHVVGTGNTSATKSLIVQNSAVGSNQLFYVSDNGDFGSINSDSSGATASQLTFFPTGERCLRLTRQAQNIDFIPGNAPYIGSTTNTSFSLCSNNQIRLTISAAGEALFGAGSVDTSAQLAVTSTTKGLLFPRMTTVQKNAIVTPTAGLVVYDTTLNKLSLRTAAAWETITSV